MKSMKLYTLIGSGCARQPGCHFKFFRVNSSLSLKKSEKKINDYLGETTCNKSERN